MLLRVGSSPRLILDQWVRLRKVCTFISSFTFIDDHICYLVIISNIIIIIVLSLTELHQAAQERAAVAMSAPQRMKGVSFPLDRNAEDAIRNLGKSQLNFVQLSVCFSFFFHLFSYFFVSISFSTSSHYCLYPNTLLYSWTNPISPSSICYIANRFRLTHSTRPSNWSRLRRIWK